MTPKIRPKNTREGLEKNHTNDVWNLHTILIKKNFGCKTEYECFDNYQFLVYYYPPSRLSPSLGQPPRTARSCITSNPRVLYSRIMSQFLEDILCFLANVKIAKRNRIHHRLSRDLTMFWWKSCDWDLTLVLLRVFPKHIFLRGVVATPLRLSILKVI